MNKTYLVAMREYVENLRTKTFWIGIISFPVIIAVAVAVSIFMREAKDVRYYSIIDYSEDQWLSQAIEKRRQQSEFARILKRVTNRENLAQGGEKILDDLKEERANFKGSDIQLEFFDLILETVEEAEGQGELDQGAIQRKFINWFQTKSPEELAGLKTDLDQERWKFVEPEGEGEDAEDHLNGLLKNDKLFAYFVIGDDPLKTDKDSRYVSNNLTDDELKNWFSSHATEVVREKRVAALELSDAEARSLRDSFSFDAKKISEETGEVEEVKAEEKVSQFAPVAFVYLLWIAVMMTTQMLLTNTVEEKSNRIIEVLLSSVSPLQLMAGKIVGIAATGLTLVVFWVICAIVGFNILPALNPEFSQLGLGAIVGDPRYLGSFIAYFLGGYFFFAAILAGIGAVCNSLKEAQNLQQPVFILLIVPLLAMLPVVNDPNGTLARVLTYFPPFTPFLMMNRAAGPPPAWEYVATTILIIVSIAVAFWGAAKIFRIGILMTGKPPKVREILGWLRAPVGAVAVSDEPKD